MAAMDNLEHILGERQIPPGVTWIQHGMRVTGARKAPWNRNIRRRSMKLALISSVKPLLQPKRQGLLIMWHSFDFPGRYATTLLA